MALPGSKVFSVGWRWQPHPLGPGLGVWGGGGWLRCQETESWAPHCPEGPSCVTGLPFHIGEGRAGKSFSEVVGSRANHACAQRSSGGAAGPICWGDVCPHTSCCLSSGTQWTPRTHGVPWTKGPPGEYRIFPVGLAQGVPEMLVLPQGSGLRAVGSGREASPGALAGGAALGHVEPSVIQTITTVQSALRQGGRAARANGHKPSPLKPLKRVLSLSRGQSPDSRGRGLIFPPEASPSPRPPGLWTLTPTSACISAWPSLLCPHPLVPG